MDLLAMCPTRGKRSDGMARVLIVYGTAYGQTERIAHEIARVLREAEHEVSLVRGDRPPAGLALEEYDGAVVAASVLYGRHQRYIERFVRERATRLNAMPSAFVSVCGAMANPAPDAERVARGYRERLLASHDRALLCRWSALHPVPAVGALDDQDDQPPERWTDGHVAGLRLH